MSTRTTYDAPWPQQTALPPSPPVTPLTRKRSLKRRRSLDDPVGTRGSASGSTSKVARQVVADQGLISAARDQCQFFSGNDVISCYPTSDTVIAQHEWASFVWNSRRPELVQTNRVDIFLFHGDSRQQILHFRNVLNPSEQAGTITAQVNDSWWGSNGVKWAGSNISYPFYWAIIRSDTTLDGNAIAQPTFSAVQTTLADSVVASIASASAASVSSASAQNSKTQSLTSPASSTSTPPGNIQNSSGGSGFPHWAIAVITVLAFLAIAATCVLAFLIIRRVRRRNQDMDSNRNSMGSASPMIPNVAQSPGSPLLAGAALPIRPTSSVGHGGPGGASGQNAPSVVLHDGASTISRAGSAGEPGPFSGQDAKIMADAFRQMLRKPFVSGQAVDELDGMDGEAKEEIINRELAEEGRDIRSVGSSRGVKVETLSDTGDTGQNRPR